MESSYNIFQPALQRPVVSSDHELLVVINASHDIEIRTISDGRQVALLQPHRSIRQCLPDVIHIRWSPESVLFDDDDDQDGSPTRRRWLFLATTTNRLYVLSIDLPEPRSNNTVVDSTSKPAQWSVLIDYQFETHMGKLTLAEFVISHKQVLTVWETAAQASITSTQRPHRQDITHRPKFPGQQGFAQNTAKTRFALVVKSKGQDCVLVFGSSDNHNNSNSSDNECTEEIVSFSPTTVDVQGIKFSPNNDPVLALWDAASHGIKVSFYTLTGQILQQLELNDHIPRAVPAKLADDPARSVVGLGLGLSYVTWVKSRIHATVLVAGDCEGRIIVRGQNNRNLTLQTPAEYHHTSKLDASVTPTWQESSDRAFNLSDQTVIDLHFDPISTFDLITLNSDTSLMATKLTTFPKALWIWSLRQSHNHQYHGGRQQQQCSPVSLLLFQHDIRQVIWHPVRSDILIVLTARKKPILYIWVETLSAPQAIEITASSLETATTVPPSSSSPSSSSWKGEWLSSPNQRSPFLLTSKTTYVTGLLGLNPSTAQVMFQPLTRSATDEDGNNLDNQGEESEFDMSIDTPSKPARSRATARNLQSPDTGESTENEAESLLESEHLW